MYQNTLGVTASDSTRYHHVWSTMVHWLLCCGALGTPLIIYPACVYLCWTRLCGGGGREKKADRFLPACMWGAPQIQRDCWLCVSMCEPVFMRACVCMHVGETEVAAIQLCQHELWSDLHRHRHRHTHKTFNCQKKKKVSPGLHCV